MFTYSFVQCLWAPLAFGLGATFMVQWELKQQGVLWNNISIPAIDDDHLSFLAIAGIMALDAVLYSLITWYIEGVFPGRYGVSKPWYFPFMRSYWCGQSYAGRAARRGRTQSINLLEDEQELMRECIHECPVILQWFPSLTGHCTLGPLYMHGSPI